MKQSLFLINFQREFQDGYTQERAMQFARETGFSGVEAINMAELSVPDLGAARRLRGCADALGLEIPCLSVGIRLERKDWREQAELLEEYLGVADALGAKLFHHTLVPTLGMRADEMPRVEEIRGQLIEACTKVQQRAARYGIRCVYEDQGYVVNGIRAYETVYRGLPLENKGVVADLGNSYFYEETPEAFVAHFLHEIVHVHVKDYLIKPKGSPFPGSGWYTSRQGTYLRGTVIGHGCTDFVQIFRTLIRSGYDGWFTLEFDGMEDSFEAAKLGKANMSYYYEEAARQLACSSEIRIAE